MDIIKFIVMPSNHSHSPQSFSNIDSNDKISSFSSPLILKVNSFHANLLVHDIAPIQITGKLEDSHKKIQKQNKISPIHCEFPKAFKNKNWQLTSQHHI